jgi:hypothetical protein
MGGTTAPALDCSSLGVANDDQTIIVVTEGPDNSTPTAHGLYIVTLDQ